MKAYLIDPELHAITEIEYDGSMQSIYETIDATMFDAVRINEDGDVIYVDDEGLYNAGFYWAYEDYPHPLAGKGMVLGTDHQGDSCEPTRVTLEHLGNSVRFISMHTAIEMGEALDEQNQAYMEEHPDTPIIFGASAADILKDKA